MKLEYFVLAGASLIIHCIRLNQLLFRVVRKFAGRLIVLKLVVEGFLATLLALIDEAEVILPITYRRRLSLCLILQIVHLTQFLRLFHVVQTRWILLLHILRLPLQVGAHGHVLLPNGFNIALLYHYLGLAVLSFFLFLGGKLQIVVYLVASVDVWVG